MTYFKAKKFLALAFMLVMLIFVGEAKAGIITDRLPFYCYVDHQVNTYNQPNGQRVGYISANVDLIRVTQVRGDGWAYGDYPGKNGRVARWFRISELCADPGYSNRGTNVQGAQNVFRTRNSGDTIGSVSNNESVIVIADNGSRAQILYRLNNGTGYKVGWVPSSAVNPRPNPNPVLKGDVNGDGKVNNSDVELLKNYLYEGVPESQINKANADVTGDGKIDIYDVTKLVEMVYDKPTPPPSPTINLNVRLLKQNDPQWKNVPISSNTIGGVGCTITSLAMKYNYHNNANITPPEMMRRLSFSGNSIIWSSVNKLGYTTYMVDNRPQPNNEWFNRIYTQLKAGKPVIVGAYQINSKGQLAQHWVVVKGYSGNSTTNFSAADFQINDPMNPFNNLQQFFGKYNKGLRGIVY
jgi:hypothetical protein